MKLMIPILALAFLLTPNASAQAFGPITHAPQHALAVGAGCTGNFDCSADFGYAEKINGATYSYTAVELIPNLVTAANGKRTVNLKSVTTTGVQQIVYQSNRVSVLLGVSGGAALPSGNSPSFNFASTEHATIAWRLNKVLNQDAGGSNNHLAITPYFTQIAGVPNGNTIAVRLHFIHDMN